MNNDDFRGWCSSLATVWNQQKLAVLPKLFSPAIRYQEHPFEPALHGLAAVIGYWRTTLAQHEQVECVITPVIFAHGRGVAEWRTKLYHHNQQQAQTLVGIFIVNFDAYGQATELREWWLAQAVEEQHLCNALD
ncbi:MAG: nuclear transport factor 2 family protein [Chloroflexi bacterium]|nr:nuclear transport factor 2 family protein [Chloroflexota bacterium]